MPRTGKWWPYENCWNSCGGSEEERQNMKNLKRMVERDLSKSIPTLGAGSRDMSGWCARMIREYGRQTMSMMMAEAVRACPSPALDGRIRTWAARQPRCGWHTLLIPYWAMNHMVHELMKMERPDVRLEAIPSSHSGAPTEGHLRIPLYGTDTGL